MPRHQWEMLREVFYISGQEIRDNYVVISESQGAVKVQNY